jgi:UDP:flavonoid glycosyltransferase YjiC (YdhE family)
VVTHCATPVAAGNGVEGALVRVLVTSTSGSGHVHPLVPMARALDAAGHDVVWAVAPEAVAGIEELGMRARPAGLDRAEMLARTNADWPDFIARFFNAAPRGRRVLVFPVTFGAVLAPAMLEDLRRIVDEWRPKMIVHEPNELAAAPLAVSRGIPHVVVGFGGFEPREVMAAAESTLRNLWAVEGLQLAPWAGFYDDLYLHPFPPSFGPAPFAETIRPMRPMGFDGSRPDEEAPDWLARLGEARACAYVTFGTEIAGLAPFGIVVEAFADVDVDVVLTLGRDLDPGSIKPCPPNVRVERYLPQRFVLARCSLLVSHAGSGAMLGAAARGIPQLCLPIAADQFENADVVAAAGCGVSLDPHEITPETVRHELHRLLDDQSFAIRADAVAEEIAAMHEPGTLVATIEALASADASDGP